jgi:hypothetical protein
LFHPISLAQRPTLLANIDPSYFEILYLCPKFGNLSLGSVQNLETHICYAMGLINEVHRQKKKVLHFGHGNILDVMPYPGALPTPMPWECIPDLCPVKMLSQHAIMFVIFSAL